MPAALEKFIGTWKLLGCEHRLSGGEVVYPIGKEAKGILIYTADGYMSGALMAGGRKAFQTRELFSGTEEEKAAAMETYVHYAGRFEVKDSEVLHYVETSLFPNWVGSTQKRRYYFSEGNRLELSVGPFISKGQKQTAHLFWVKVG